MVYGELPNWPGCGGFLVNTITGTRDFAIAFVHLIVTLARLARPGGLRSVVAESVLVRHQLPIFNLGRKRAPNLWATDEPPAEMYFVERDRVVRGPLAGSFPPILLQFHLPRRRPTGP